MSKLKKPPKADPKTREKIVKSIGEYVKKKNINDPRRISFLKNYFDPASDTFSNGIASAIAAGFTPQYARNILSSHALTWIKEYRDQFRERLFNVAEVRLKDMVMSDSEKIALDATKFTLQTLGKDIYTVKTEKEENVTVTHKLDDEQMERIARRMNDKLASKV